MKMLMQMQMIVTVIVLVMMTLGLRQIQTWKKVAQEDSTEEDDEETDALHVWGGLECGLKND